VPTVALAGLMVIVPLNVERDGSFTSTEHSAVLPPSAVVTVIVAEPAATAVTTPFATVATAASLVDHVTALFVALAGATVAVRVSELPSLPTFRVRVLLLSVTPVTGTIVPPVGDMPISSSVGHPVRDRARNPIAAITAAKPSADALRACTLLFEKALRAFV